MERTPRRGDRRDDDESGKSRSICHNCLARQMGLCQALKKHESTLLERHLARRFCLARGQHLYDEGDAGKEVFSLIKGWVLAYHQMADGRRQGLEVLLPGAFFGMQPVDGAALTHSAICLTDVDVCCFPFEAVVDLVQEHPDVGLQALRMCAQDRIRLHDHIVNVGRRSARQRVAYFLVDLLQRLRIRSQATDHVTVPLNQQELGDILGLTPVHLNRVFRGFRELGLISTQRGMIDIIDAAGLAAIVNEKSPSQAGRARKPTD
ncbi:MAG: Crp/Fnr family transcriptional regulator [Hyphomicrobiaceae bacterium]